MEIGHFARAQLSGKTTQVEFSEIGHDEIKRRRHNFLYTLKPHACTIRAVTDREGSWSPRIRFSGRATRSFAPAGRVQRLALYDPPPDGRHGSAPEPWQASHLHLLPHYRLPLRQGGRVRYV